MGDSKMLGQMTDGSGLLFAEVEGSSDRRHRRSRIREGTLRRERLLRRLAQTSHVPLTLLVAPAGYGKTTLLEHCSSTIRGPSPGSLSTSTTTIQTGS